jgi:hypothetical protein
MTMNDRVMRANARSRRVPPVLFRLLLAWILSAIILAVAAPALAVRGLELRGWMMWAVIVGSLVLCLGPLAVQRLRRRP